jgi:hypothetical protein
MVRAEERRRTLVFPQQASPFAQLSSIKFLMKFEEVG